MIKIKYLLRSLNFKKLNSKDMIECNSYKVTYVC